MNPNQMPVGRYNEYNTTHLKKEINNLLWMYAPSNVTLKDAEERAVKILNIVQKSAK